MNLRSEIRDRAFALTEAITTIPDLAGKKEHTGPPPTLPFYSLHLGAHRTETTVTGEQRRVFSLFGQLYVAATDPEAAARALDELWAAMVDAVQGDPTLGGLVADIEEVSFDPEPEDQQEADQEFFYGDLEFAVIADSDADSVNTI
ncbi:MAG: GPP34 family phosphoprotein [Minwuiales bacterium]|nr:GPP34 family phosphoprotein [Minwuiales bacterium]